VPPMKPHWYYFTRLHKREESFELIVRCINAARATGLIREFGGGFRKHGCMWYLRGAKCLPALRWLGYPQEILDVVGRYAATIRQGAPTTAEIRQLRDECLLDLWDLLGEDVNGGSPPPSPDENMGLDGVWTGLFAADQRPNGRPGLGPDNRADQERAWHGDRPRRSGPGRDGDPLF
jgi:hypothetical protein